MFFKKIFFIINYLLVSSSSNNAIELYDTYCLTYAKSKRSCDIYKNAKAFYAFHAYNYNYSIRAITSNEINPFFVSNVFYSDLLKKLYEFCNIFNVHYVPFPKKIAFEDYKQKTFP